MHRYHRHERFSKAVATNPEQQRQLEADRATERDFILDCLDLIEGRQTPGAKRAETERQRLLKRAKEAKRRALCGADPLNITEHTAGKPTRKVLAGDPVEYVGAMSRTRPSVTRLHGKNKLDVRQLMAAETYRDAYETIRASLGGAFSQFEKVNNAGFTGRSFAEARVIAAESLAEARRVLGEQTIIIVEFIVCDGHTVEECTRQLYGIRESEKPTARDFNYIGRRLREALTQLADLWQKPSRRTDIQSFRPAKDEVVAGDEGVRNISSKPFVSK